MTHLIMLAAWCAFCVSVGYLARGLIEWIEVDE